MNAQELVEKLVQLINEGYIDPHSNIVRYDDEADEYWKLRNITYTKDRVYLELDPEPRQQNA